MSEPTGSFGGPVFRTIVKIILFPWWIKEKLRDRSKEVKG